MNSPEKLVFLVAFCLLAQTTTSKQMVFPAYFKFGTASASYQVEGANHIDGKGPSIWDDFTASGNHIKDNSTGDDGPDSYFHYKDDVRVMKDAHMDFYRFSISWSRVMADGTITSKNEKGLQYYDNLINELLANGIEPMVTMYHWDLPSRIQDLGGMVSPLFPRYFKEYARLLFSRYGDRVKKWITFNEPYEYCFNGYANAAWAPGSRAVGGEYYCAHYTLLAHAEAYHLYYEDFAESQKGRIGVTLDSSFHFPKDPHSPEDIAAAERFNQFQVGTYAHPIFIGGYPEVVKTSVDRFSKEEGRPWSRLPEMTDEEKLFIKGTADFFGLNHYSSRLTQPANTTCPNMNCDMRQISSVDPSWPRSHIRWLYSVPEGLRGILNWIKNQYNNVEVIISENGWGDGGEMDDLNRIEYLRLYLNATLLAIVEDGCNVTGHTTWSIFDNFEWLLGFTAKFGIHSFDPVTKKRTPKASVQFLRQVIDTRVLPDKRKTHLFP